MLRKLVIILNTSPWLRSTEREVGEEGGRERGRERQRQRDAEIHVTFSRKRKMKKITSYSL